jgi:hypothetical protein
MSSRIPSLLPATVGPSHTRQLLRAMKDYDRAELDGRSEAELGENAFFLGQVHEWRATVRIGGIVSRERHPGAANGKLNGGPQMVEVSRDGRRVYFTNSLYGAIDEQFYPDGIEGWMVKLDAAADGGIGFDPKFFLQWPKSHRPHQVRLEGGDCSSDSYCYP